MTRLIKAWELFCLLLIGFGATCFVWAIASALLRYDAWKWMVQ